MKQMIAMRKLYILDLLCALFTLLFKGLTLMLLWEWIAVPSLGLPALSYIEALGIVVLSNVLTNHSPALNIFDSDDRDDADIDSVLTRRSMEVWGTVHALALGWIIKVLM